jgi:hypothetical protein
MKRTHNQKRQNKAYKSFIINKITYMNPIVDAPGNTQFMFRSGGIV